MRRTWRAVRGRAVTCSRVGLPASLACSRHRGGEPAGGEAAEAAAEKLTLLTRSLNVAPTEARAGLGAAPRSSSSGGACSGEDSEMEGQRPRVRASR